MAGLDSKQTSISSILTAESIKLGLQGKQRDQVLQELVQAVPELRQSPDRQHTLLSALLEREKLHSTAIGDGVALPHARNALVSLVKNPVIVFGRHPEGVPFGALDHRPAQLFFLLVATTVTQHLGMLARLSRLLRDANLREKLLLVERPEKVIELIKEAEKQ